MIRFLNAYFPARTVFLGISEACLVTLAFLVALVARLGPGNARAVLSEEQGLFKIVFISAAVIVCMYYFDLYDPAVAANVGEVLAGMIQALGAVTVVLGFVFSIYPAFQLGHSIFLIGFVLVGLFLLSWRTLFLRISVLPRFAERVVIFGDSELGDFLASVLPSRRELGLRIVEHIKNPASGSDRSKSYSSEQLDRMLRSRKSQRPDRIVIAMKERRGQLPVDALLQLKNCGVNIQDGAELYEAITGKIPIEPLNLGSLLFSPRFSVSVPLVIYKRICSVMFSAIALILMFPLMIVIGVAVRWSSAGPIIFCQKRVGQNGKLFTLYKFRSMVDRADRDGSCRPAENNDGRITPVGKLLRRTRIDELPQLFNILRGDMHFVGPRPFVPNQEQECLEQIPYYRHRLVVKPGATGWAQVNRGYCSSIEDNVEKLGYDLFYIKNMSIGLDLLILFKTTKILLLGRGAQ